MAATKSEISIISEIYSCGIMIWGLNLYFLDQGIRWTQYSAWLTIIMCVQGKNPRWPPISQFISENVSYILFYLQLKDYFGI